MLHIIQSKEIFINYDLRFSALLSNEFLTD